MTLTSKFNLPFLALAITAMFFPTFAQADTYNIFALDSDQTRWFSGMDADGNVILKYGSPSGTVCAPDEPGCFRTYSDGVLVSKTDTLPSMTTDNGTPCTPSVPVGATVLRGVCNNAFEAFMGYLTPGQFVPSLYTGSSPSDALGSGYGIFLYMNSEGDIVWNDPGQEHWYEAIHTTSQVPEPGSLALLATGTLAAFGAIRRRLS